MNIFNFKKVIYKGNIDIDFYLYCLKKFPKIIKYLFINLFYYIVSLTFKNKKDIYEINKYRYFKELDNIDLLVKNFITKDKLNNYIIDKKDIIIDNVASIFIDKKLANEVIAYELDDNYKVKIDLYKNSINDITNCEKLFIRNRFILSNIDSKNIYIVNKNKLHYMNKRKKYNELAINLFIIALLSFIITCISFCFTFEVLEIDKYLSYFEPLLFLLNFLPIFLILFLLTIITKKLNISFLITSSIIIMHGIANQTKVLYRDDVVKFEDLTLLKEASIMTTKYNLVIKKYTILACILVIILFFILKRYIPKLKLKLKKRLPLSVLTIILMLLNYNLLYKSEEIYDKVGDTSLINTWLNTRHSQIRGLVYPFINSISDSIYEKPKNYNEDNAKKILNSYEYVDIPNDKKVNIIAIMLEAYNDFSKYDNIEFNTGVYDSLKEIQNNSLYGNLIVKIFGGGTVNTERNFLTSYYNLPNMRTKTNSYVWYFKEQGYTTEAMHPIYGSFYNRITADFNMGFDNYYYYENKFSSVQDSFLEDNDFFDYIIEGYNNNKNNNKPYFNFSVTYQNHGPYDSDYYPDKLYYINNKNYTMETYNTVSEYFYGIKKTNEALKKLIDYFDNENEPVIVMFFGDHNPYLGETGYEELGINLDINSKEGFLNYYTTPFVIHANSSAKDMFNKDFTGKLDDISPIFLMTELFDYLDLKGNNYMNYMSDLKQNVDVITEYYYKEDNKYVLKEDSNYKKEIKNYFDINYYYSKNYINKLK